MMRQLVLLAALSAALPVASPAQANQAARGATAGTDTARGSDLGSKIAGLRMRSVGPAITSGRIADVAVHPRDRDTWYVATASGGVWKTTNAGTTFSPIFDSQGSYSIGVVAIDQKNPSVVWVGTGENNAQRSVGYGDGVYKSVDGGRTWTNVGLKESEHIGQIVIDPRNSDVVYVASQGPLWRKGGDRGVYKTTDGGKTWNRVLHVDDWTGANDVVIDPRNPDVLVATTWQRARRQWTFIGGGPGSGVHRSTDGGATWKKSQSGFPSVDLGRIGLSVSPADPDVVYAVADAADNRGGFFRSRDGGINWERMSGYQSGGNYYNEIIADPKDVDRVYAVDVMVQITEDGGRTFGRLGERGKHVDNHSVWIDPDDTDHLLIGSDGGLYESFDRGRTYRFFGNLPVTQFYKVTVDNSAPFYRIYGGTQDNFSLGGPSRTRNNHGIANSDWFVTAGGDGFQTVVDPTDPNVVYSQSQHGVLSRFNLATGEAINIQPQEGADDPGLRWNWDSPVIISPHSNTRLYFAAQRLYRTNDRGDSWDAISPDLTRQIDRNRLKVMDRVWQVDALGKNASTSLYGSIVALAESPAKAGLLYVGTDDGLIQVSEDDGANWRRIERFTSVPDTTFVSDVQPSSHDVNTVYATFANYKSGDFKPYVVKSTDLGRTWRSIAGNLPARGSAFSIVEDHVDPNLLFVGTEFGVYFTNDGGARWTKLPGVPTVMVRDLAIHRGMNDLVAATFGRGFYVLDDYTPLRGLTRDFLAKEGELMPVKRAPLFAQSSPLGLPGVSFQGSTYYLAENPPYGAIFTYHLKDGLKTRRATRQEVETAAAKRGEDVFYPAWDSLKVEDREEEPAIVLTVADEQGRVIRRLTGPTGAGMHRVAWDLRFQPANPVTGPPFVFDQDFPFFSGPSGPHVVPGTYQVTLAKRVNGTFTQLGAPQRFEVQPLDGPAARPAEALALQRQAQELQRAMMGTASAIGEAMTRVRMLKRAVDETPQTTAALRNDVRAMELRLVDLQEQLTGDPTIARRGESTPPSLMSRLFSSVTASWGNHLGNPTRTQRQQMELAQQGFGNVLQAARATIEGDLRQMEAEAERQGVPWTPGRALPTLRQQ